MESAKFTIEAKAAGEGPANPSPDGASRIRATDLPNNAPPMPPIPSPDAASRMRLMVQSLLAQRFKLQVHKETREEQVYELVVDKGGSKLKEVQAEQGKPQGLRMGGLGQLIGMAAPLSIFANILSQQTGRSVIDRTGLTGKYDFILQWTPDPGAPMLIGGGPYAAPPPDLSGPSLFTAVQEQLGLKLQSTKGPVEILVIDHAEKPDAN